MAQSELSKMEKNKVWRKIEGTVGKMIRPVSRRRDWRVAKPLGISVFVTFSRSSHLFYDVRPQDLNDWLAYKPAFVVFVMGTSDKVLIVPALVMKRLVRDLEPKGYGEYKLHIRENERGGIPVQRSSRVGPITVPQQI